MRRAFAARGHDAWSCDLLPARDGSDKHYQCDIFRSLSYHTWDLIILHPPCTAMSLSGNRWYHHSKERELAIRWTHDLWSDAKANACIGVALENPTSVLWSYLGKPQYIQPHMFGHRETKKTGILTYNLPPLVATNQLPPPYEQRIWKMGPSPTRQRDRSETYQGIADAMADQWGGRETVYPVDEISHCVSVSRPDKGRFDSSTPYLTKDTP